MKCSYCVFFVLFGMCFLIRAQDIKTEYYTPKNIYCFANSLYDEGEYLRAAGEFQRCLFTFDSLPTNADSIFYKIGLCYRLGGNFPQAINYFNKVIDKYPKGVNSSNAYYQIALTYSLMGKHKESNEFLNINFRFTNQNDIKLKMYHLMAFNYILNKEWKQAIDFLSNGDEIIKRDSVTIRLVDYAKEGKRLPHKNEFLAGLFSSIIPGMGKMYCNRSWDGFFSLVTIGLTSWQAYDSFRKDGTKSVKGWFFGSMSTVFYLGNIYGSVVSAKIYNEQQEEKFLAKVKLSVNVELR